MERVRILMNKYELGKQLGQGNFAKVYYARNIKTNQVVAIKVFNKEKLLKQGLDLQTKREITAMGKLKHSNILQVYEVMANRSKIYLVLEYARGGELFAKVAKGRLKEDVVRWVFQQLISAVDFCHTRGIYHRDLKLENLLLDEFGNLKVCDFGLSTYFEPENGSRMLRTVCGTPTYVAPEVITRKGYDGAKADIYSCGVILYAMLAGHLPFRESNLSELYRKMRNAQYKCPTWFPSEVHKLLAKILDPNPKTRITIAKIMENPWFSRGFGTKPPSLVGCPQSSIIMEAFENVQEPRKHRDMNAFDIISLSSGFDLSGLFVDDEQREEVRFLSKKSTPEIMCVLLEAAKGLGCRVTDEEGGFVRMTINSVVIGVQVLEFTTSFHLVEVKRCCGDSLEYKKVVMEMKLALKEIVWAWQGNLIYKPVVQLGL